MSVCYDTETNISEFLTYNKMSRFSWRCQKMSLLANLLEIHDYVRVDLCIFDFYFRFSNSMLLFHFFFAAIKIANISEFAKSIKNS